MFRQLNPPELDPLFIIKNSANDLQMEDNLSKFIEILIHEDSRRLENLYNSVFLDNGNIESLKTDKFEVIENYNTNEIWNKIKYRFKESMKEYKDRINWNESTCPICGFEMNENKSIEHILPKSIFPSFIIYPSNLVCICCKCNENKANAYRVVSEHFHPYYDKLEISEKNLSVINISQNNKVVLDVELNDNNRKTIENFNNMYKIKETYNYFLNQLTRDIEQSLKRLSSIDRETLSKFLEEIKVMKLSQTNNVIKVYLIEEAFTILKEKDYLLY